MIQVMNKANWLLTLLFLIPFFCIAQTAEWKFSYQPTNNNPSEFDIIIDIQIPQDFHMYSFDQVAGGPIPAQVEFKLPDGIQKIGGLRYASKEPEEFFDDIFEIPIRQLSGSTQWTQRCKVTSDIAESQITGSYSYQLCKDDGFCINPFPEEFSITIPAITLKKKTEEPQKEEVEVVAKNDTEKQEYPDSIPLQNNDTAIQADSAEIPEIETIEDSSEPIQKSESLWVLFIMGFLGGILAFLTPCVFPMVPMTVSMFLKRNKEHVIRDILIYGLSIVVIFITLGICITLIFGVDALNKLSTDPLFNCIFFVIFILFAISFFGFFELVLPSSIVNYFDRKADTTNGFLSIFFMAFTLVLVSFSCTAMIIGTLLVESVASGSLAGPIIGMLGFSIALALPFILFAAMPSLLTSFTKSGEWMHDIKLSLGFIELGFALKFLSKADLVAGWGILPRDLFIAIWIILLIIWGLCILRVIRIGNTEKVPLSKTRIGIAICIFGFACYLIPGFLGKPIEIISGYLPPMTTQKIHVFSDEESSDYSGEKKYGTLFHSPYGINGFYDYEEGLAYAQSVNKPVLLDFTGLGCENCRKIEMNVWAKPDILKIIKNDYVLISLYLDSREPLDSSLVRKESYAGKTYNIRTVGEHWSIFMMKNYHGLMQPYYVLLSPSGERLAEPITYTEAKDAEQFKKFLLEGLQK